MPPAASLADARRGAGLTQKQLAEHLEEQLWIVERMEGEERGLADHGVAKPPPGALVRRARHDAGLTQAELARRSGVPLWTVDRLERDLAQLDDAERIAVVAAILETPRRPDDGRAALRELASPPPEQARAAPRALWVRNTVLASVATLVVIRFFAEDLGVVPRSTKLVDIPILLLLLLLSVLATRESRSSGSGARYVLPAVLFFAVGITSVLVNSGRVEAAPALLFLYGFLAPMAIFHIVRTIWPTGQALAFSRLLVALAMVQFTVVLFIDLPEYLATDNPDVVSGTFGENAYQLVFFLLMGAALVAGIVTVERTRLVGRFAPLFFVATIATILLAQYRSLLLTTALTVLMVATLLGLVRVRGAFAGVVVVIAFALSISYVPAVFPQLKFGQTIRTLTGDPGSYAAKRLEAGGDVGSLYTDQPSAIVLGTGPGTFSSRAWETFADSPTKSTSALGVTLPFAGGSDGYRTDVADRYTIPRLQERESIEGSFALTSPLSSYYALLAEVGLVGFLLLVAIYGRALFDSGRMTLTALRRAPPGDPLPGLLLASTAGFFVILQMAILENWLEVTRLTFILWTLFAVATKEFEARYDNPRALVEASA